MGDDDKCGLAGSAVGSLPESVSQSCTCNEKAGRRGNEDDWPDGLSMHHIGALPGLKAYMFLVMTGGHSGLRTREYEVSGQAHCVLVDRLTPDKQHWGILVAAHDELH